MFQIRAISLEFYSNRAPISGGQGVESMCAKKIRPSKPLESQLLEELQSHSGLMTPTPKTHSPRPDLDPLSDPILT